MQTNYIASFLLLFMGVVFHAANVAHDRYVMSLCFALQGSEYRVVGGTYNPPLLFTFTYPEHPNLKDFDEEHLLAALTINLKDSFHLESVVYEDKDFLSSMNDLKAIIDTNERVDSIKCTLAKQEVIAVKPAKK